MGWLGDVFEIIGGVKQSQDNLEAVRETNASNERNVVRANRSNRKMARESNKLAVKLNRQDRKFAARESQLGRRQIRLQARADRRLQREFAQKSTGWAFDDLMESADEAGIHRLAALGGASGTAYSPVGGSTATSGGVGTPGLTTAQDDAFIGSAYAGSSVGEGMGLIGDAINSAAERTIEADRYNRETALAERVAESEIQRNLADAELAAATSRTTIERAARAARTSMADVEEFPEISPKKTTLTGETVRTPQGADPGEVFMGLIDELRGAIKHAWKQAPHTQEKRSTSPRRKGGYKGGKQDWTPRKGYGRNPNYKG